MKNLFIIILYLSGILIFPGVGYTQENQDHTLYHIETKDGSTYTGNILSRDSVSILLQDQKLGEISLRISDIKVIRGGENKNKGDTSMWSENPQATRYFWSPNGYGLKPGEGYYQNIWIFFNQASVGLTDNFSIGGGMIPIFLFAGAPTPVWITPKISIPVSKDNFNIGAGALAGTVLDEDHSGFGILYGITTFGSRDTNLSIGLGYGYIAGEFSKTPAVNISGMVRTGKKSYLMSENYFLTSGDNTILLLTFGGRWIIGKVGLDGFLLIPTSSHIDRFFAIPMLGITIPFGPSE